MAEDNTLQGVIERIRAEGQLTRNKGTNSVKVTNDILKTISVNIEGMYNVMCVFWSAVKKVFPEAWGLRPQESRLMHSAGIQAMGVLMDRIMPRMHQTANVSEEVEKCLRRIAPYCSWTDGTWEGIGLQWNEIQNLPRHIKALAEYLVQIDFAESQRQVQK